MYRYRRHGPSEELEVGRQIWYWKDFEVFELSLVFLLFFWPEPVAFPRVYGTWDLLVHHVTIAAPYQGGIDPRLAVYARSWDGHYTTTRRDRLWVWFSYIWLRVFVITTVYVMKIVMTGATWVLLSSLNGGILNLDLTTLCMSRTRWVLDDLPSSIFCFRRRVLPLWLPFWSRMWSVPEIFFCPHWTETGLNIRTM